MSKVRIKNIRNVKIELKHTHKKNLLTELFFSLLVALTLFYSKD